jgi:PST family polysaccharide transporter
VAVRLSECWFVVPGTLVAAIVPLALEARLRSEEEFRDKLQRICNLLTWLGIAVGVAGTIAGPFLTRLLYGAEYAESGTILSVLCWSGIFVSWGLIRSAAITAQGNFGFALAYTFSGAVLNLVLNLVMIPRLGPVGAAIALLASHATCSTLLSMLHPPLRWTLRMQMRSLNPITSFRDMRAWSKRP